MKVSVPEVSTMNYTSLRIITLVCIIILYIWAMHMVYFGQNFAVDIVGE